MNRPILAIETSDKICGACIYFDEDKYFSSKVVAKHSHSEMLFKSVDLVISQSGIQKSDLEYLAVSEGPGSFTGLRIGMSAAKGMAYGLNIPIVSVPTFEAFALQLSAFFDNEEVIISNKINADEVYYAKFHLKMNSYIFTEELKILPKTELNALQKSVKKFGSAFSNASPNSPDPEFIARWARLFGEKFKTYDIDNLEPHYLKNFIVKEK